MSQLPRQLKAASALLRQRKMLQEQGLHWQNSGTQVSGFRILPGNYADALIVERSQRLADEKMERSKPFRFMDLPAELREQIYIMLIPSDAKRCLRVGRRASKTPLPACFHISQTNRTVRKEALAAYFASCLVSIRVNRRSGDVFGIAWVEAQDEEAIASIKLLQLCHISTCDHGEELHDTRVHVNLVKEQAYIQHNVVCSRCEKAGIVPDVVENLQKLVDDIGCPDGGRKRLTKDVLSEMIHAATDLCVDECYLAVLLEWLGHT